LYLLQRKRSKWRKLDESQIFLRFKDIGEIIQSLLDNFYTHEYLRFPFNQIRTKDTKKILDETVNLFNYFKFYNKYIFYNRFIFKDDFGNVS
jgi:hypothetical protein